MGQWEVINANCLQALPKIKNIECIFADPPDNIALAYNDYTDRMSDADYGQFLSKLVAITTLNANVVWISFNSRHILKMADAVRRQMPVDWDFRPCVQTFTFGNYQKNELANCHRPLWRLTSPNAKFYPDDIRVESERQRLGDKRANPNGKIPGDVFDFPRVTGNSHQRRSWHPTQLHEGLVERCIRYTTAPGDLVVDPFGGTGTTLRVCQRIGRPCKLIEIDSEYCERIKSETSNPA